jgi:hypothetical protein
VLAVLSTVAALTMTGAASSAVGSTLAPPATGTPAGPPTAAPSGCDQLDPTACLLPFPDDFFTVKDPSTPTGRRVDFPRSSMPANVKGVPIDPTEWNRNDGFSPGTPILVHVGGIDLAKTGIAPITNIGASLDHNAPIVVIDSHTGDRVPYWAELDANDPNAAEQALIVHPAVDLTEGHHYIVALRNLRDSAGNLIQPNPVFRDYRDHLPGPTPTAEQRRPQLEPVFGYLQGHGVDRRSLYLAWDFTVASEQSLSGRMLHMRDDAFAKLGSTTPAFKVTSVTNYTPAQNAQIARHVEGTFSVPSYLNQPGGPPGSEFNLGPDGLPAQILGNIQSADFVCNIPRATVADATAPSATVDPGHAMLYGHGLLGSAEEVDASPIEAMANEHNFVICGTDWLGLSDRDVSVDAQTLSDLSQFPALPDRGQQGMLDFLFLGRLMTGAGGFDANPAFQAGPAHPVIDASDLYYYGNSQGGIQGGALTAVSQEFTRSVLGVPGMDYSLLLNRSVDFAPFLAILNTTYPDRLEQQIGFGLLQMLWDRSEADGYAQHLTTNPLPGTPAHEVLMDEAFGDHQVANIAAENEARTIGARVHEPALAPGRSPDLVPFYGIPPIPTNPFVGSSLVMWDSGSPPPPLTNTPPTAGADPHGVPRAQPSVRLQDAVFLLDGTFVDVCGGGPCEIPPGP